VLAIVLDLPGALVHEVGAPQAELHLWVVAQANHLLGGIEGAAAPALRTPIFVLIAGNDGFGAHRPKSARQPQLAEGLAAELRS
jgi:hypothetical protein